MKTAEDILNDKQPYKMVSVGPNETVVVAIEKMNQAGIGAILIEKQKQIVGIWTERDLLRAMGRPDFNPARAKIGDHMSVRLHSAECDTPIERLEEMFLGLFIRHILIKKADQYIGLLSIGDVLRASLLEKDKQIKKLNTIASWQYYENWGWDRKKR
ncbi:MAG: CBS domain-containing protein [Desulfatitalea sp.]|nr:CBS domain-containing protein [Desulfatitalea sp.]NNK02702.1 CBS domain-containing protein [Desulfatitalea sp.]